MKNFEIYVTANAEPGARAIIMYGGQLWDIVDLNGEIRCDGTAWIKPGYYATCNRRLLREWYSELPIGVAGDNLAVAIRRFFLQEIDEKDSITYKEDLFWMNHIITRLERRRAMHDAA